MSEKNSSPNENSTADRGPQLIDLSNDINPKSIDHVKLCSNLWDFMLNFSPDASRPVWNPLVLISLFKEARNRMSRESMVLNVAASRATIVFGPLYGEGDSLITLMSQAGTPPKVNYVMLGCYLGHGFAPLECLCLLLSLKMLYPSNMVLLKGHHEESLSLEMLKAGQWLQLRGIMPQQPEYQQVIDEMKRVCCSMPPAALIDSRILCMAGGPGPMMREHGLKKLQKMSRNPRSIRDKNILMEASWSVMILNEAQKEMHGMPYFTPEQASEFIQSNGLHCLIRGRQMVDEGFLNKPKDVITLISAVAYLDNFRNHAAVLKIEGSKGTIIRYKMEEGEQLSLELVKPGMGRNAVS